MPSRLSPAELQDLSAALLLQLGAHNMKRIELFRGSRTGANPNDRHWVGGYCVGVNGQEYQWTNFLLVPITHRKPYAINSE